MSIDDLSGRELDAAVAGRVFGYLVEARANARTGAKDFVCSARAGAPARAWVRVPFYGDSLSAAIAVELALRDRGWWRIGPRAGWHRDAPAAERVVLAHADGRTVEAFGPQNEALCRAALKALDETSPRLEVHLSASAGSRRRARA
jgi:hypothetical protein